VNLIDAQGNLLLYSHPFYNRSVPILDIIIPIPVIIGSFYVTLQLNYTLGIDLFVGLVNYRDV